MIQRLKRSALRLVRSAKESLTMRSKARLRQCATILGLLYIILLDPAIVLSAPMAVNDMHSEAGCYYNLEMYSHGEQIRTNEPCLNCTCTHKMLMCYLNTCPYSKPIGSECAVERLEGQCCPSIKCPEVPVIIPETVAPIFTVGKPPAKTVQQLPHVPPEVPIDGEGCYTGDVLYPEGSQVPSFHPCELCYCIRNHSACVMQNCTLDIPGCLPNFKEGHCCPVSYTCDLDAVYPPTTTTSLPPTGCWVDNLFYYDGSVINMESPCEHCYCMKGELICAVQECRAPEMDGCTAILGEDRCCPFKYDCPHTEVPTIDGGISSTVIAVVDENVTEEEVTFPPPAADVEQSTQKSVETTTGEEEQEGTTQVVKEQTPVVQDVGHTATTTTPEEVSSTANASQFDSDVVGDDVHLQDTTATVTEKEAVAVSTSIPQMEEKEEPTMSTIRTTDSEVTTTTAAALAKETDMPQDDGWFLEGSSSEAVPPEAPPSTTSTLPPPSSSVSPVSQEQQQTLPAVSDEDLKPEVKEDPQSAILPTTTTVTTGNETSSSPPPVYVEDVTTDVVVEESSKNVTEEVVGVEQGVRTEAPGVHDVEHVPESSEEPSTTSSPPKDVPVTEKSTTGFPDLPQEDQTVSTTPEETAADQVAVDSVLHTTKPVSDDRLDIVTTSEEQQPHWQQVTDSPYDATTVHIKTTSQQQQQQQQQETTTPPSMDETVSDVGTDVQTVPPSLPPVVTTSSPAPPPHVTSTQGIYVKEEDELSTPVAQLLNDSRIDEITSAEVLRNDSSSVPLPVLTTSVPLPLVHEGFDDVVLGQIPGEGDCYQDGVTYKSGEHVPSKELCQINCTCRSSIIRCKLEVCKTHDLVKNMSGCRELFVDGRCCPEYFCEHIHVTPGVLPPSDSLVSSSRPIDKVTTTTVTTPSQVQNVSSSSSHYPSEVVTSTSSTVPPVPSSEEKWDDDDEEVTSVKPVDDVKATEASPVVDVEESSSERLTTMASEEPIVDLDVAHIKVDSDVGEDKVTATTTLKVELTSEEHATSTAAYGSESKVDPLGTLLDPVRPQVTEQDMMTTTSARPLPDEEEEQTSSTKLPPPPPPPAFVPPAALSTDVESTSEIPAETTEGKEEELPTTPVILLQDVTTMHPEVAHTFGGAKLNDSLATTVEVAAGDPLEDETVATTESLPVTTVQPEVVTSDIIIVESDDVASSTSKSPPPSETVDAETSTSVVVVVVEDDELPVTSEEPTKPIPTTSSESPPPLLADATQVSSIQHVPPTSSSAASTDSPSTAPASESVDMTTTTTKHVPVEEDLSTTTTTTEASSSQADAVHNQTLEEDEISTQSDVASDIPDQTTSGEKKLATTTVLPPSTEVTNVTLVVHDLPVITEAPSTPEEPDEEETTSSSKIIDVTLPATVQDIVTTTIIPELSDVEEDVTTTTAKVTEPSTTITTTEAEEKQHVNVTLPTVQHAESRTDSPTLSTEEEVATNLTTYAAAADVTTTTTSTTTMSTRPPLATITILQQNLTTTSQQFEKTSHPQQMVTALLDILTSTLPSVVRTSSSTSAATTTTEPPATATKGLPTTTTTPDFVPLVATTTTTTTEDYGEASYPDVGIPITSENFTLEEGDCIYNSRIYSSAQQIPRNDPCDFCFCFRGDIICLQQSCPPPIDGCHEEEIPGFCCPRFECPVTAKTVNVTSPRTPYVMSSSGSRFRTVRALTQLQIVVCEFRNKFYNKGDYIASASSPCMDCTCGEKGTMKCAPKKCEMDPLWQQHLPNLRNLSKTEETVRRGRNRF